MVASLVATGIQAQPPDLDDLLDRAADYVVSYKHDFVGVVAEQTYRQEARGGSRGTDFRGFPTESSRQKRDLKADVKDGSVIEGRASDSRFRRYQVQTDEKIAPVKK